MGRVHDDDPATPGDRIAAALGSIPFSAATALLFAWLLPGLLPAWALYAFVLAVSLLGLLLPRLVPELFGNVWDLLWGMMRRW